jgi:hypothetical protein
MHTLEGNHAIIIHRFRPLLSRQVYLVLRLTFLYQICCPHIRLLKAEQAAVLAES